MSDNLKAIETRVDADINPAGAPGSILALNHNEILKDVLKKLGKYSGSAYSANKQLSVFPSGSLSWDSNAMNDTNDFTITVSKLTADLNDFGEVLSRLKTGDLIRFKDYAGRSVDLLFQSYVADVDGSANDIYIITVKGVAQNINYTYQDTEVEPCVISVSGQDSGEVPTKTSDLTNDGEDGSPFVDLELLSITLNANALVIGGMGSIITDEAILITYFSNVVIGQVLEFKIVNDDVFAIVNSSNISIQNSAFLNETNLTFIYSKGITTGGSLGRWFEGCTSLEYAELPNLSVIRLNGFKGCTSLDYDKCDFQTVNYVWQDAFSGATGETGQVITFPKLVGNAPSDGAFELVRATVICANLVSTVYQSFNQFRGTLIAPKLTTPNPATNNNVFNNSNVNTILYLNKAMATANSGQPDEDVVEALADGATVIYIGNRSVSQFINDGEDGVNPYLSTDLSGLGAYADDASAGVGGVAIGHAYVNSSTGAVQRRLV